MNLYPVTIVENFYENPDAIRKFALSQKHRHCHEIPNYSYVFPGTRTDELIDLNQKLYEKVCNKLFSVFHNPHHDYMRWNISTRFQCVTEDYGRGVIHSDHNTIFAGVIYLTPSALLESGTSLFKKNSAFDLVKYQQELEKNDERFKSGQKIMDTAYHAMFDEIIRVNNVYNTLIIYEGDIFHAANQFFGKTLKDGRLAQVFFINHIDAQRQDSFPLSRVKSHKV